MSQRPLPPPLPVTPPIRPVRRPPGLFRDGKKLVVEPGAQLPDRCVKCNADAQGYRKRFNLSWHHPALFLTILAGVLIYLIIALIVRKTARIDIPLCPRHRTRRRNGLLIASAVGVLGVVCIVVAIAASRGMIAVAGIGLILAALIAMIFIAQTVTPATIDDRAAWLNGVCPGFLADLPDWPPQG